ncbi:permease [Propionivibrio limicola]|uniref:permease n=1 Tax=Propionivibrio limicola TaxID=167645 RepID=UPI001FEC894B|nr:permease [Propionivibrio limicola]
MRCHDRMQAASGDWRRLALSVSALLAFALGACSTPLPVAEEAGEGTRHVAVQVDETAMLPVLGYSQLLLRLTPQELARERIVLTAMPPTPSRQVRLALLLGQPHGPRDLGRALNLLDAVLKSTAPDAVSLQPLARTLASQYQERQRLEALNDKLAQQAKDAQRRSDELQQKLDAITDIEKTMTTRPPQPRTP